ncbi:hypothetical protein BC936DRAFT_137718 [Jimgerdemannia flammicorona]|uniref:peptidylprolyl isomerase n=1 Tax=Jimgerdemannia flammicorona TaxID=994334 RepID=A0A433DIX8_9FUNG|nr:hypothetical protein BC936DRAFT_137718 [Jimgerdemannia flammicorona]
MTEPTRQWSTEELATDAVSKKDIVSFLQENSSSSYLIEHKLNGKFANVVKTAKKDALIVAYNALFATKQFKVEGDLDAADLTKAKPDAVSSSAHEVKEAPVAAEAEIPKFRKETIKKGNKTTFPKKGDTVTVWYTGMLEDGTIFDTNVSIKKKAQPLRFKVGVGKVVRGFDEALLVMSKGEKAKVTIEPEWAYGKKGIEGKIPPNSTLIFEIELTIIE